MMSKQRAITFLGVTHALGGDALSVGEPAPDFRLWYFNQGEGGGRSARMTSRSGASRSC